MPSQSFFKYGVVPLFVYAAIIRICGGILSNEATSLARKKYPYVPIGRVGGGLSWDPYIRDEAKRFHDDWTVDILKYNVSTVLHFGAAMLGYLLLWMLADALQLY